MHTSRNPRSDSKLKRLPIAVMSELVDRLSTPGVKQSDVLAWLRAEHGVSSSRAALSQDLEWLAARVRAWKREQRVNSLVELRAQRQGGMSEEERFALGQELFSELAIAEEDGAEWARVQKVARDKEQSDLERRKFQRETATMILDAARDQRIQQIEADPQLSRADKIEAIGRQMFGELWE